MKVINIDDVEGKTVVDPGATRTVKVVLHTKKTGIHYAMFPPGQQSSAHTHAETEELVYIVKGKGTITAGDETQSYAANHLVYIPPGVTHQYKNAGNEEMILLVIYNPPTMIASVKRAMKAK